MSFAGIAENESLAEFAPADPDLAVGVSFILQVVNHNIRVWRRSELPAPVPPDFTLASFLELSGGSEGTDPRVIFDPDEGRFIVSAFGFVNGKPQRQIVVAVSKTEAEMLALPALHPLDSEFWFPPIALQGKFDATTDHLPFTNMCAAGIGAAGLSADQPRIGYSQDQWLVSALITGSGETRDHVIYFLHKEILTNQDPGDDLDGISTFHFVSTDFCDLVPPSLCCTVHNQGINIPMPIKGDTGAPFPIFVGVDENSESSSCFGQGLLDGLIVYAITDPFTDDEAYHHAKVGVGCFDPVVPFVPTFGDPPDPENNWPGEPELWLNAQDARVMSAQWRAEGTSEYLYVTLTTNDPPFSTGTPDRAVVKWYKIDLKGWPSGPRTPAVVESGQIAAPAQIGQPITHYFYPSGVVNDQGVFGVVMAQGGEAEAASIAVWARAANGEAMGPEIAKSSPFGDTPDLEHDPGVRWGDYFDIELDPLDDSFWITGSYMKSGGPFGEIWGTWIQMYFAQ